MGLLFGEISSPNSLTGESMRQITIVLCDELYSELEAVAAGHEMTFTPATWAQELIESLATRRLPKVRIPITAEGLERKADPMEIFND
jgi:hypothetical protein